MRWPLVVFSVAVGIALLVGAWALSNPDDPVSVAPFWSGLLVNLGSAIVLVVFVFWLERSFVRTTRRAVREAADKAADQAATTATAAASRAARQETSELRSQLRSLQEQLESRRAEASASTDVVWANLSESVSWEALRDAFRAAEELHAIDHFLKVLAGPSTHSPLISFTFSEESRDSRQVYPPRLQMKLEAKNSNGGNIFAMLGLSVQWTQGMSPTDALHELEQASIRDGQGSFGEHFDAAILFSNLREGLASAVTGRRQDVGAWRSTRTALEILGPDWVIVKDGAEHRGHGPIDVNMDAPEWADPNWWELVTRRVRAQRRF